MAASSEKLPRHFEFSADRERTSWPITCSTRCLPNSICACTCAGLLRAAGDGWGRGLGTAGDGWGRLGMPGTAGDGLGRLRTA
eukprot:7382390-Prymnesium_polylepis.1